jgi:hypothetical protein
MLSAVLNSETAIQMSIQIMMTFVAMRQFANAENGGGGRINELRKLLMLYIEKNDKRVDAVIEVLNRLIEAPPVTPAIGFKAE